MTSGADTTVHHYDGDADAPAWSQIGDGWVRHVAGIGGLLAASKAHDDGTRLLLTSLHGNVAAIASGTLASGLLETHTTDEFGIPGLLLRTPSTRPSRPRQEWAGVQVTHLDHRAWDREALHSRMRMDSV